MRFSSQSTSGGVSERLFTVGDAPGVLWAPDDAIAGDVPRFEVDRSQRFFARHPMSLAEGRP
jgi:hypothetical protein